MASLQFDANTQNKDVGIVLTKVRLVAFTGTDIVLPEVGTFVKVKTAGRLVWYFEDSKETNVIDLEAGEFILTPITKILATGTIDGTPFSTTNPLDIFWGVTSGIVGGALAKNKQ